MLYVENRSIIHYVVLYMKLETVLPDDVSELKFLYQRHSSFKVLEKQSPCFEPEGIT